MIKSVISAIISVVFETALIIFVIIALIYFLLREGVELKDISFGSSHIGQLYLKLDKKLILKIDGLTSRAPKKHHPLPLAAIAKVLPFFQKISIRSNAFTILYRPSALVVRHPDLLLVSRVRVYEDRIEFSDIYAHIKKYDFDFAGDAVLLSERLGLWGVWSLASVTGSFEGLLELDTSRLTFYADSEAFGPQQLRRIADLVKSVAIRRQLQKTKAGRYRLEYLIASTDLKNIRPDDFAAKVALADAAYTFADGLPPLRAQSALITYAGSRLFIDPSKARYRSKKIDRISIAVTSLPKDPAITIRLALTAPLDAEILELLRHYRIKLPLMQKEGAIKSRLLISIRPKRRKSHVKGSFELDEGTLCFGELCLRTQRLRASLTDRIFRLHSADVAYQNILKSDIAGEFDGMKKSGLFRLEPLTLRLGEKDALLLDLNNSKEELLIDAAQGILKALRFGATYQIATKRLTIKDLTPLIPHSPILRRLNAKGGALEADLAKRLATGSLHLAQSPLWRYGQNITRIEFKADYGTKRLWIEDFAYLDYGRQIPYLRLTGIELRLGKSGAQTSSRLPDLDGDLQQIGIDYEGHRLTVTSAKLRIRNGALSLLGKGKRADLWIAKETNLTLIAKKMDDEELADLLGTKLFYGGSYDLKLTADKSRLAGTLWITDAHIKNLTLLNNLFAFLNTIPALATFSDPGFSTKGLPVQKGVVEFELVGETLRIKSVYLTSPSLTIVGSGSINLLTRAVSLDLQLQTLKKVSGLLKKIPVVGYVLLGDDGTIATKVEIRGTLDDPKFSSKLPGETVTYPLRLIGRTLKLPFKLFE